MIHDRLTTVISCVACIIITLIMLSAHAHECHDSGLTTTTLPTQTTPVPSPQVGTRVLAVTSHANATPTTLRANNAAIVTQHAQQWGLSVAEYQHYQWLMEHTPSGQWYRHLDPPEVLALNADDETSLRRYTRTVVKLTHQRVSRELAFNRAYGDMFQQLYPDERAITLFAKANPWQAGDRLWVVLRVTNHDTKNPKNHTMDQSSSVDNALMLQRLLTFIRQNTDIYLDIFVVGSSLNNDTLKHWAQHALRGSEALGHRITINPGNARYQALCQQQQQSLRLPYVAQWHQGHLRPVSLSAL